MAESKDYQMAIDLLCFHLGLTEEQAREQLGLEPQQTAVPESEEY